MTFITKTIKIIHMMFIIDDFELPQTREIIQMMLFAKNCCQGHCCSKCFIQRILLPKVFQPKDVATKT